MKGAIGYLLLFGGIGTALYFLLKSGSQDAAVKSAANNILADPTKAAQVPGATREDKYAYLIQAGTQILSDILKATGVTKPEVATTTSIPEQTLSGMGRFTTTAAYRRERYGW